MIRTYHSRAPIRVCDNGGWTDTWFAKRGRIFNIAVSPFAEVQIDVHPRAVREHEVEVFAENFGERFVHSDNWSHHPLIEAAVTRIGAPAGCALNICLFSEAPPGASTGTSAAVSVALLAALHATHGRAPEPHALAYEAHAVETEMLKRQCGIQDQLAAAYGGVCDIDMHDYPHARVTQIALNETTAFELERRLALIYVGTSHDSSKVHERVIRELEDAGPDDARIEALRQTAPRSVAALLAGDMAALGAAMVDNTQAQAGLNPALVGADAQRIIAVAREYGALGWKVNGAGGDGGSVTLLCGDDASQARAMLHAVEAACGYRRIPTRLSTHGVRVWETRNAA